MNMNVSDWFGLLTTAFAIGALVGSLFRNASVKARLTIAAVVTLTSTIPLPFDTRPSLAMTVYALTGLLSVTTLTILTCCLFQFSVPNRRKRIATAAFVTGIILYGGEVGAISFDLFQYGYLPLYVDEKVMGMVYNTLTMQLLLDRFNLVFEGVFEPMNQDTVTSIMSNVLAPYWKQYGQSILFTLE